MKSIRPAYWCLVSTTLLVTLVFVVAVLLSIIPYRCLWLEEYYWITDGSYVALYPILVFTYLLLGWWTPSFLPPTIGLVIVLRGLSTQPSLPIRFSWQSSQ